MQDTRYASAYLFGAVCPRRGVGAGLVMPRADTEGLNAHLAEIARTVAPGAHAVLIMDGAGWHKSDALVVPDTISVLILPPYYDCVTKPITDCKTCVFLSLPRRETVSNIKNIENFVTQQYYAPELNPVENIWQYLRRNKLAHRLYNSYEAIVEACCEAWNFLIAAPGTITSIAARDWANVST